MKKSQIGSYFPGSRHWRYPRIARIPYDLWREARAFYNRGRYGWSPCDVWDLNTYLEDVIAGSVQHLAEGSFGSPGLEEFPTHATWVDYLSGIVADIKNYQKVGNDLNSTLEDEVHAEAVMNIALLKLVKYWGHLWD